MAWSPKLAGVLTGVKQTDAAEPKSESHELATS